MNIHEFRRMVDDIADSVPEHSDKEVTVMVMERRVRIIRFKYKSTLKRRRNLCRQQNHTIYLKRQW